MEIRRCEKLRTYFQIDRSAERIRNNRSFDSWFALTLLVLFRTMRSKICELYQLFSFTIHSYSHLVASLAHLKYNTRKINLVITIVRLASLKVTSSEQIKSQLFKFLWCRLFEMDCRLVYQSIYEFNFEFTNGNNFLTVWICIRNYKLIIVIYTSKLLYTNNVFDAFGFLNTIYFK